MAVLVVLFLGTAACSGAEGARTRDAAATIAATSAGADGTRPTTTGTEVAKPAPATAAGDTAEAGAYGDELLSRLRESAHGDHITKVRVASSYKVYKVTLETDLGRADGADTRAGDIVRDIAGKLLTETTQWAQDHPTLWVGGIEILDVERDAIDFRLGAERDDRKPAADDHGAALLAALHTSPDGARVAQVRLTLDHDGRYEVAINTDLSSHLPDDYSVEAAQTFNAADRIVLAARTWIAAHPGFDVAALRVYDVERGLITIKLGD